MYLRAFVEKTPTRYFARHNGFAAEPLMEPEVRGQDRRGPVVEPIALRLSHGVPFWGYRRGPGSDMRPTGRRRREFAGSKTLDTPPDAARSALMQTVDENARARRRTAA